MKIEHIAIWTADLERMKDFYNTYFNTQNGDIYVNESKGFSSYFLTFDEGTRIELMQITGVSDNHGVRGMMYGYAHLAISVGGKEKVNFITERLRSDGYNVLSEPRKTGDGYYESVVEDVEGNWLEITE